MTFLWSSLIQRARVYKDDDHDDEDSWLDPADWLNLFNVEYALLYPRWVRSSLISPAPTTTNFTGSTVAITGVLAVVGVARVEGNRYYPIQPLQSEAGRAPWLDSADVGRSIGWIAHGTGDDLTVTLYPTEAAGTYAIRYITRPAYATSVSSSVDLPYGGDERLVLGVADRAGIKDSSVSRNIKELKAEADAALNFLAAGRGPGLRVRVVGRTFRNDRFASPFPADPRGWHYV